ncbi:MAG: Ig-like domain-containing domain, partial [Vulcanimicrobiaceae bacterium]
MRTFALAALFIGVALLVWLRIGSVFAGPSLPQWIVSVSPIGKAQSATQIRIIFARDVAPLGAIDDPTRATILSQLSIDPAIPGRFILLTPKMIGFEPRRALPLSTRVRVTLRAGARDLAGDSLLHDVTWTFHTPRLVFSNLPSLGPREYPEITPSPLEPVIRIQANTDVIETSLASHAAFIASDSGELVSVRLDPGTLEEKSHSYTLVPVKPLRSNTTYELRIAAGVRPQDGNLTSNADARGFLKTYGRFQPNEIRHDIVPKKLYPQIGSPWFADGDPGIVFTNPLDVPSLAGHIAIDPKPVRAGNFIMVLRFRPDVAMINPELLQPKTTYRVRIGPGIKDVYGQVLGTETTLTFTTGDLEPTLRAPQGNATLVADPRLRFPISATNLSQGRYFTDFVPVTLAQYLKDVDIPSAYVYRKSKITVMQSRTLGAERPNVESTVSFPLTSLIGAPTGGLAYRITTQDGRNGASEYSGFLHVSDLGVFAQVFRSSGFVSVTSLNTGRPIPGAHIEVRVLPNTYASSGNSHTCASGITDHNGYMYLSKVEMKRCEMIAGSKNGRITFIIIARHGSDWSVLKIPPYFVTPDFGLPGNRFSGGRRTRGVLFFDRDVYKRGDTADLTGLSYVVHGDRLIPERDASYLVSISDPMGHRIKSVRVRTDAYGVFDTPISIAKTAGLGFYWVSASGSPGGKLSAVFRVAEFQPPNVSVDVSFARPVMRMGTTQHVNISARYL